MRTRRLFALALFAASALVLAVAAPGTAVAAPLAGKAAVTTPMCDLASPEAINGAQFTNNQTVNGTWTYSTGVACATGNLADIALYEQLDFNGAKVSSQLKGFTGVARDLDAITTTYHCAVCTGTWLFEWGQILKAPASTMFVSPPSGCVVLDSGLYELCVQTKTVTL